MANGEIQKNHCWESDLVVIKRTTMPSRYSHSLYCRDHFHLSLQAYEHVHKDPGHSVMECARFLSFNLLLPIMAHKFDRKLFQLFRGFSFPFYGLCVVAPQMSFEMWLKKKTELILRQRTLLSMEIYWLPKSLMCIFYWAWLSLCQVYILKCVANIKIKNLIQTHCNKNI